MSEPHSTTPKNSQGSSRAPGSLPLASGALDDWKAGTWQAAASQHGERRKTFATPSGVTLEPLYGGAADGGFPGVFPFTRGVRPTMYRGRFWTMRQYAGFSSARDTNQRFRALLASGQSGLSTAFDLPTQIGYDSDHALAEPEVGLVGVPINSLRDMERLFDQIDLGAVSTSMTINASAGVLLCMYLALCRRQNVPKQKIRGTVQNDILKEYAARGNFRFPPQPSLRLVTDLMAFCAIQAPEWNTISISGYHIREAGSTAVQEVAFTLANAKAYVAAALEAGLALDSFAPRLSFFFNAHNHLFEEVAKFRAARRMWARIMKDEFRAQDPESWMLRFHTQTAGSMLTSQQPDNNVVRVTVQALAAILGGTQSLHTNSRDEALGLPSVDSATLALRTQQVLAHESGVADVIDPLGGAPFVEALTDELEARALALMQEIERRGGAVRVIESGWMQREIHASAMQWQRDVERGERTIIGVNAHQTKQGPGEIFRPDPKAKGQVLTDLAQARAARDAKQVGAVLDEVERAARQGRNVVAAILPAVEAYATLGEICGRLEQVFGVHKPVESFA